MTYLIQNRKSFLHDELFPKAFAVAAIGVTAIGSLSHAGEDKKAFYATGAVGYSQIIDIDI